MMYKIVTRAGVIVAFGPNDDQFEPALQEGDVVTTSDTMPEMPVVVAPAPTLSELQAQLAALSAQIAALSSGSGA